MQLSLYADYSCRVLIYLASMKAEKSSIREISDAYAVSMNHLVKVVHHLGRLGYVQTSRGRGGGISLGKNPSEVVIGQVIRDTEAGFDLVECFRDSNQCPITPFCGLKHVFNEAMREFLGVLDQYTLADVVKQRGDLQDLFASRQKPK